MATRSWLDVAADSPFSIENIPFGIISTPDSPSSGQPAIAIGNYAITLRDLAEGGALAGHPEIQPHLHVFNENTLNSFAALGRPLHKTFRAYLRELLLHDTSNPALLRDNESLRSRAIHSLSACTMHLPMRIDDYIIIIILGFNTNNKINK
jgi:fumarylacetoacetase